MCEINPVFQEKAPLALVLPSRLSWIRLKNVPMLVRAVIFMDLGGIMCDSEPTVAQLQEK